MKRLHFLLAACSVATLAACGAEATDDNDNNTGRDTGTDVTLDVTVNDTGGTDTGGTDTGGTDTGGTDTGGTDTGGTDTGGTDTGGTDTGGTDTGGTDTGNGATCADACNFLSDCSIELCTASIIDVADCTTQCEADPDAFGLDQLGTATCEQVNAGFCSQGGLPDSCECGGADGDTCGEINQCLGSCAEGDTECQQVCFDAGSPAAQQEFNALATCVNDNCADNPDIQACAEANCETELDTCFAGGAGDGAVCVANCSADTDCRDGEFCFAASADLSVCVTGTPEQPTVPADSTNCLDDAGACSATETCVQTTAG